MKEENDVQGVPPSGSGSAVVPSRDATPSGTSDPSRGVERPILMSAPMVRATLAGLKTQTRRPIKPQPDSRTGMNCTRILFKRRDGFIHLDEALEATDPLYVTLCPYGKPGDRLYVRETFAETECDGGPCIVYKADGTSQYIGQTGERRLGTQRLFLLGPTDAPPYEDYRYKPSIHMPRWASRITLEVVSVRVERLQNISEADARAEGVASHFVNSGDEESLELFDDYLNDGACVHTARYSYEGLWESINGAGSWEANPWVWVVEFRVRDRNEEPGAGNPARIRSEEPGGVITATPK